jgi:hypothetical protein
MATSLRSRLGDLAAAFVASVVGVIRESSVEELFAHSPGRRSSASRSAPAASAARATRATRNGGRLARRSGEDIAEVIDQIVDLLRKHPKGLRAEDIRSALGLEAKEMPRPLREGLQAAKFTKSGQKRATTYLVKGGKVESGGKRRARGKRAGSPRRKATGKRAKAAPRKDAPAPETTAPAS